MTYLFTKIKLPGKNFWDNYNPSELLVVLINVCVIHRERNIPFLSGSEFTKFNVKERRTKNLIMTFSRKVII